MVMLVAPPAVTSKSKVPVRSVVPAPRSASAVTLINGFAAIVTQKFTEALAADNAADQGSIDAATAAIAAATAEMTGSTGELEAALLANSGGGTPTP